MKKRSDDKKLTELGYISCPNLKERIDIFVYRIEEIKKFLLVLRIDGKTVKSTETTISEQVFIDNLAGDFTLETLFVNAVELCNINARLILFLIKFSSVLKN